MTVIFTIEHPETHEKVIASDGLTCAGECVVNTRTDKLRRTSGGILIGYAGDHRVMNLLDEMLRDGESWAEVYDFCNAMWKRIRKDEWKPRESEGSASQWSARFVVVDGRGCWDVGRSFDYLLVTPGWPVAVGSGATEACGAALALIEDAKVRGEEWTPAKVAVQAVRVAAKLDTTVGGEVFVRQWEGEER